MKLIVSAERVWTFLKKALPTSLFATITLFSVATRADGPVDYYESHLKLSTPVGVIDYGRSQYKGGWVYGFNLFNKPFEDSYLQAKITVQLNYEDNSFTAKADFYQDGKGIPSRKSSYVIAASEETEFARLPQDYLVSCNVKGQWQNGPVVSDVSCGKVADISLLLATMNHIHLGLAQDSDGIKQSVRELFSYYKETMAESFSETRPTGYTGIRVNYILSGAQQFLPVRIYDPSTKYVYTYDTRIRAVQLQNGNLIHINWSPVETADDGEYINTLVPESITDADGNPVLTFNNETINPNGIAYRIPLTIEDYAGRKITYTYDQDRLVTRKDPMGHEWTYTYEDYRPEDNTQNVLKRLDHIEDPEGFKTTFKYEPATALISGYDLPGGGGYNRSVSWSTNAFGKLEKRETKTYQSGRVEDRVYIYGDIIENPNLTTESPERSEGAPAPDLRVYSKGDVDLKAQNRDKTKHNYRWVWVSYGRVSANANAEAVSRVEYIERLYGKSAIGGALPSLGYQADEVEQESNTSTRQLDRFEVNGQLIYKTKKSYNNDDGTHITLTEKDLELTGKTKTYQSLKNFSKGSRPNSTTTIVQDGYEKIVMTYDRYGYLKSSVQGKIKHEYQCDVYRNLLSHKVYDNDKELRDIEYTYDDAGNLLTEKWLNVSDEVVLAYSYTYDDYQRMLSNTDGEDNTTAYSDFTASGQYRTEENARHKTTKYSYDDNGNLVSVTTPLGYITSYSYTKTNRLNKITYPDLSEVKYQLNGNGKPLTVTDQLGYETKYTYDNGSRLTSYTTPADENGGLARTWSYAYNEFNQKTRQVEPDGDTTIYTYHLSQLINTTYPNSLNQVLTYNEFGQLAKEDNQDQGKSILTYIDYDKYGNRTDQTDTNGYVTEEEYDALGRLQTSKDQLGGITYLTQSAADNLLSVVDPEGNRHEYKYDVANHLVEEVYPDQTSIKYSYYPTGELKQKTDAKGQITEYALDDDGRISHIRYYADATQSAAATPEKTVTIEYDHNNRVTSYYDADTKFSYGYNPRGEVTEVISDYGVFSKTQKYAYYPDGGLKSYTNPEQVTYTYGYNISGELESVNIPGAGLLTYSDYQWNIPQVQNLPGGSKVTSTFNGYQQPETSLLADALGEQIENNEYGYEAQGYLNSIITNANGASRDQQVSYDQLYRVGEYTSTADVDSEDDSSVTNSYGYDGVSNRISHNSNNWVYQYNRLISTPEYNYSYDLNGSLITITDAADNSTVQTAEFNLQDRLVSLTKNNVTTRYSYDPAGVIRLKKTNPEATIYYLYGKSGLSAEYDTAGKLLKEYQFAPQQGWNMQPLFQKTDGQYYYYQLDYRNAPKRLIDSAGDTVWQASYDDFGNADVQVAKTENNLRLPGQYYDKESGYYYNYFRYYDPTIGRYISSDPIGLEAGINTYVYVSGNPVTYLDLMGLEITGSFSYMYPEVTGWSYVGNTPVMKNDGLEDYIADLNFEVSGILIVGVDCKDTDDCGEVVSEWSLGGSVAVDNFPFSVPYKEPTIPIVRHMSKIIMLDKIIRASQFIAEWKSTIVKSGKALLNSPTQICRGSGFSK